MRTITFYSYKGGTGRTLAVANAARHLSGFRQKVVAVDLDLEAPGLHYKFALGGSGGSGPIERGLVDYIHAFYTSAEAPKSIRDFSVPVTGPTDTAAQIDLIPAGAVPRPEYWSKLAEINWQDLLYEPQEQPRGPRLFLELKERIENEFRPDFLLIDSRTGITEIGGVATAMLADTVVCLLLNNAENLEGSRAVLRSFRRAARPPGAEPLELIIALARIPSDVEPGIEERLVQEVRQFLSEDTEALEDALSVENVFVLHSEPGLQIAERVLVGSVTTPEESVLLRDYLRLFGKVIPRDAVAQQYNALTESAWAMIRSDPDATQRLLEEIAHMGFPDAYRELIRFHKVRNSGRATILGAAQRLWEMTDDPTEALLWQAVKAYFDPERYFEGGAPGSSPVFLRAVWEAAGSDDVTVGQALARLYEHLGQLDSAADVWRKLLETAGGDPDVVRGALRSLRRAGRYEDVEELINRSKASLSREDGFVREWAEHTLERGNDEYLRELVSIAPAALTQPRDALLVYRLLTAAGQRGDAEARLAGLLDSVRRGRLDGPEALELGTVFERLGRLSEFRDAAKSHPDGEEILRRLTQETPPRRRRRPY